MRGRRFVGCAVGFTLIALSAAMATAALSASQQSVLAQAQAALKNAEADLAAAKASAGTAASPATGSRLKLTQVRLETAKQRLAEAAAALTMLPGDDAGVKAAAERHAAGLAAAASIEAIITAKPAPPAVENPNPPVKPVNPQPIPANAPKLDYKQEKLLKDAEFHLGSVEGGIGGVEALLAKFAGEGPKPVHADVLSGLATIGNARVKHKYAMDALGQLPANHPSVQPAANTAATFAAKLDDLQAKLTALDGQLSKVTGMANYPKYDEDFAKLLSFAQRYSNFELAQARPAMMAEIIRDDAAVAAEAKRIAETYQPLADQKTEAGERMEKRMIYFVEKRTDFAKRTGEYMKALPGLFDADIAEANKLAETAIANDLPAYFGDQGGIVQRLGWAKEKLAALAAFDAKSAEAPQQKFDETVAQLKQKAESLRSKIIAANELPPDRYTGADRKELEALAVETWKVQQPMAQVLAIRIPSAQWTRDTGWRRSSRDFYLVDASTIQVQLLVKHDEALAIVRPINFAKNHLASDRVTAGAMDDIKEEMPPQRFVRIEKIK